MAIRNNDYVEIKDSEEQKIIFSQCEIIRKYEKIMLELKDYADHCNNEEVKDYIYSKLYFQIMEV